MFGSNSPSHPERARDPRVRLAHPDSQIQLSNSTQKTRRIQRQPLTIPVLDRVVKWDPLTLSHQIHNTYDTLRKHSRSSPARHRPQQLPASLARSLHSNRQKLLIQPSRRPQDPPKSPHTSTNLYRFRVAERLSPLLDHGDPEPPPGNGPCRNRTYNLAIKSRLLCQLS